MKIRVFRNPAASFGCSLREGDIGHVDVSIGRRLVEAGIAECLDDPTPPPIAESVQRPQTIKAVPPPPAIAEVQLAAIQAEPAAVTAKIKLRKDPPATAGKSADK